MKTYIVFVCGVKKAVIKAANHNAAERKAYKMFPDFAPFNVSVAYTEQFKVLFGDGCSV